MVQTKIMLQRLEELVCQLQMLHVSYILSIYYNNHFCRLLPLCHIVYNRAKTSSGIVSRKLEELLVQ